MKWIEGLSDLDRRTLLLIECYQKWRRKVHFGYSAFGAPWDELTAEILKNPVFKQARTVTVWLQDRWQASLTWEEVHWQGYVEYCFSAFPPDTPPMPGQLRNLKLVREYQRSIPQGMEEGAGRYEWGELEEVYSRKLRPELRGRGAILAALGLRQLESRGSSQDVGSS